MAKVRPLLLLVFALSLLIAACAENGDVAEVADGEDEDLDDVLDDDDDGEDDAVEDDDAAEDPDDDEEAADDAEQDPIEIGFASAAQPAYGAAMMAIDTADDLPLEATYFQDSELSMQGLLQGEVDVLAIGVNSPMTVNAEGGDLVIWNVTIGNDWTLVTTGDIDSPEDLDGTTLAIHSEASTATPMVQGTLSDAGADAEIVIIAGSPNRAQAMTQGEIDATPLFLTDALNLTDSDPDQFQILLDYSELPFASQALVSTQDWLDENREIAHDMVRHFVETARGIDEDRDEAAAWLQDAFPDDDPEYLEQVVEEYADRGLWVRDGGLSLLENFSDAVETNIELGAIPEDAPTDAEHYVDLSVLESVLDELD